tara:strand:+ start:1303 stop:1671 length:369 start_codon:yes stop_codon:yes gene_type:complete
MRPYQASLINSIILIIFGSLGFIATMDGDMNKSALVAPIFGLIILLLTPGMKKENKIVAHIVVLLTLMISLALIFPLYKTFCPGPDSTFNIARFFRIGVMLISSVFAMVVYIKSFIQARRDK